MSEEGGEVNFFDEGVLDFDPLYLTVDFLEELLGVLFYTLVQISR